MLEYHIEGRYATPAASALAASYGVLGVPTIFINGTRIVGASSGIYQKYAAAVQGELGRATAVTLSGRRNSPAPSQVSVTVSNTSAQALAGATLTAVAYRDTGLAKYHYVATATTQPLPVASIAAGQTLTLSLPPSFLVGADGGVVLILRAATGQLLQTALA